jgi:hypothetical protein
VYEISTAPTNRLSAPGAASQSLPHYFVCNRGCGPAFLAKKLCNKLRGPGFTGTLPWRGEHRISTAVQIGASSHRWVLAVAAKQHRVKQRLRPVVAGNTFVEKCGQPSGGDCPHNMKQPPEWRPRINPARKIAFGGNFYSRSHDAVIRVYDETGNVIETHEHAGEFKSVVGRATACACPGRS